MKKIFLFLALSVLMLTINTTVKSQVLISLLLGDKLNTGTIEFGLDGGLNWLTMSNTDNAKYLRDWNLGFYFDFRMKNPHLFIHTGVLVKSKMGTSGLEPYPLGNDSLDAVFAGGTVDRKINYFNVPVMLRYRFNNFIHIEGGTQLGLRYTGFDLFKQEINKKDDLTFNNDVKDDFTRIDAGALAGVGYRFNKGKGLILTLRYYYGFVDADRVSPGNQNYSSIYISGAIPIGRAKAERKAAEKAAEMEQKK
ncbi:MAG: PorT family protein [Bacteroidales bacterium]|nr:PorT family protein [Bacteroidales bacterium]